MSALSTLTAVGLCVEVADWHRFTGSTIGSHLGFDVDRGAGVGVFVAAHRFPGGPVDVGEPADPAPSQHCADGGGRRPDPGGDLEWARALLPADVNTISAAVSSIRHPSTERDPVAPGPIAVHHPLTYPVHPEDGAALVVGRRHHDAWIEHSMVAQAPPPTTI